MKKIFCLIAAFGFLSLQLSCEKMKKEGDLSPLTPPAAEEGEAGALKEGANAAGESISLANVVLYPQGKEPVILTVEIARTDVERRRGLQGRDDLAEKHGMWFVFETDVQDPFWMKETPLALDIVFVGSNYKVVDLVKETEPFSETLLTPREKYRYVLEIKSGSIDVYGLNAGDRVEFRVGPP